MPAQLNLFGETIQPEIWEEPCPLVQEGKVTVVHYAEFSEELMKVIAQAAKPFHIKSAHSRHGGFYVNQSGSRWFANPIHYWDLKAYVDWNKVLKGFCVIRCSDPLERLTKECKKFSSSVNLFTFNNGLIRVNLE